MESKGSESSSANSEEYEIIVNNKKEEEPTMEGDEADVKKTMDECLDDQDTLDTSLVNENRNVLEDVSNHTIFHNIHYLGALRMDEPKNERLIHGIMKEYNVLDDLKEPDDEKTSMEIILAVPKSSEDRVVVHEAHTKAVMTQFDICRIIFFARGTTGSSEVSLLLKKHQFFHVRIYLNFLLLFQQNCFAFTCAHQEQDSQKTIFQCHVFRCSMVEAVTKVFVSFAQAFRKKESKGDSELSSDECFLFEVTLEIKEKTETNTFELVPRQKSIFKLRSNIEKKVVVSVQQLSRNSCKLSVERCFGMLVR